MEWTYSLLLPWAFGLLWILVPTKCSWEHELARTGQGCNSEQFECLSGECLPLSVRCNDYPDCTDSSDEENCESVNCMEPRWFKCHNGRCISSAFVCDYDNDCADFSDEKNCSHTSDLSTQHTAGCSSSQFKCESDGVCIPNSWACDGSTDCQDSSDEVQGCYGKTICNGGFFCEATHHCLPLDFLCDGDIDCEGGADERNCSKTEVSHIMDNCNVENHKFQCKDNSMCIELHQLCDHTPDCLDRSDEGGNCSNVVAEIKLEWKKLRDSHRNALKRKETKSGQAATYSKIWKFLVSIVPLHNPQQNNINPMLEGSTEEQHNVTVIQDDSTLDDTEDEIPHNQVQHEVTGRKRPLTGVDKILEFIKAKKQLKSPRPAPDDIDMFFRSAAFSVKKLPRRLQNRIKRELLDSISRAEEENESLMIHSTQSTNSSGIIDIQAPLVHCMPVTSLSETDALLRSSVNSPDDFDSEHLEDSSPTEIIMI